MRRRLFLCSLLLSTTICTQAPAADRISSTAAVDALAQYLQQPAEQRGKLAEQAFATAPLSKRDVATAKSMLWEDHVARIKSTRKAEMDARLIKQGDLEMPFYYRVVGDKPKTGRSLFISLHGGGGAPKQVNDQQYENQKGLYQPAEGVYLVPRAPTNTWNLWHQGHIDGMFDRLIENLVVFEDVNPNRVYLLGYSAGGDGVYQLGPRMADRWAAASMMAGHPNDSSPLSLRNTAFSIQVGGQDAAYNRNKVAAQWGERLKQLQQADPEGYPHMVKIYADKGHWMDREDRVALPWMAKYTRNPNPTPLVWHQDDVTHTRFFWLAVEGESRQGRSEIRAGFEGQKVTVQKSTVAALSIRLNDQMLNLDRPIKVLHGETTLFKGRVERTIKLLAATMAERGDLSGVYSAEITVTIE